MLIKIVADQSKLFVKLPKRKPLNVSQKGEGLVAMVPKVNVPVLNVQLLGICELNIQFSSRIPSLVHLAFMNWAFSYLALSNWTFVNWTFMNLGVRELGVREPWRS